MNLHRQLPKTGPVAVCIKLLRGSRLEYLGLAGATALVSVTEGIVHPLLVKAVFDAIDKKGPFSHFLMLGFAYLGIGLFSNAAFTAIHIWNKAFENRLVRRTTRRTLRAYFQKGYAQILRQGHGYFIERVYGDTREGLVPMFALGISLVRDCSLLLALTVVLIYLSWQASLCLLALIPLSLWLSRTFGKRIRALAFQEREEQGATLATLAKVLDAFRIVRGFRLDETAGEILDRPLAKYLGTSLARVTANRLFQSLNDGAMVVADFVSLLVGSIFVFRGSLTFGGFIAFVNAFWRAITTTIRIFKRTGDYHSLSASVLRIEQFIAPPARKPRRADGRLLTAKDVQFAYDSSRVLNDVSLCMKHGESVILVGKNGTGKTTLANILGGFLDPTGGEVMLPDRVSAITLPIRFPPMKVVDLVSDVSLLRELGIAGADILGRNADELSAGQQQRLAVALALSHDADLYIIDEPLANIDAYSRDSIMNVIMSRTNGSMLILIMHGGEEYYRLVDKVLELPILSTPEGAASGLCDQAIA